MEAYVRVSRSGDSFRVEGRESCALGSPVEAGRPGGVFASWHWDGRSLVVRNDRYGFYPLYYYQSPGEIIVADDIARVIERGAPADLDDDALAVFLRLQTFVGDDTPFRQVRRLPPAAELVWSAEGCRVSGERPSLGLVTIPRRDAVATYAELFRRAVRRGLEVRAGQRVVLPLSGGQDSRHILLELAAQGHPPSECVTVAPDWSPKLRDDARVAALVAGAVGVPHTVLNDHEDLYALETAKNRLTSFGTPEHAWILPLAEHLRGADAAIFDGLAGDVLSAGLFLTPEPLALYRDGQLPQLAERLLGAEGACRPLSRKFAERVSRGQAVRRLVAELGQHAGTHNPLSQFYFWNRTRRAVALAPYAILGRVAAVECPYLDHELFDFLTSLPAEMLLDRSFHGEVIRFAYPEFAAIPFSRSDGPLATRSGPFRRFAWRLSRSLLGAGDTDWQYLRKPYILPRLARCLAEPRFAISSHWLLSLSAYMTQLGALSAGRTNLPAPASMG